MIRIVRLSLLPILLFLCAYCDLEQLQPDHQRAADELTEFYVRQQRMDWLGMYAHTIIVLRPRYCDWGICGGSYNRVRAELQLQMEKGRPDAFRCKIIESYKYSNYGKNLFATCETTRSGQRYNEEFSIRWLYSSYRNKSTFNTLIESIRVSPVQD